MTRCKLLFPTAYCHSNRLIVILPTPLSFRGCVATEESLWWILRGLKSPLNDSERLKSRENCIRKRVNPKINPFNLLIIQSFYKLKLFSKNYEYFCSVTVNNLSECEVCCSVFVLHANSCTERNDCLVVVQCSITDLCSYDSTCTCI